MDDSVLGILAAEPEKLDGEKLYFLFGRVSKAQSVPVLTGDRVLNARSDALRTWRRCGPVHGCQRNQIRQENRSATPELLHAGQCGATDLRFLVLQDFGQMRTNLGCFQIKTRKRHGHCGTHFDVWIIQKWNESRKCRLSDRTKLSQRLDDDDSQFPVRIVDQFTERTGPSRRHAAVTANKVGGRQTYLEIRTLQLASHSRQGTTSQ